MAWNIFSISIASENFHQNSIPFSRNNSILVIGTNMITSSSFMHPREFPMTNITALASVSGSFSFFNDSTYPTGIERTGLRFSWHQSTHRSRCRTGNNPCVHTTRSFPPGLLYYSRSAPFSMPRIFPRQYANRVILFRPWRMQIMPSQQAWRSYNLCLLLRWG